MRRTLEKNDQELNRNRGLEQKLYKVPLPVAAIFILASFFIITFSFVVDDSCPKTNLNCSNDDKRDKQLQNLSPVLISYGFLFYRFTILVFLLLLVGY